jgi:MFS-type transporter involved in bile tolerance (Atg22 family)
MGPRLTDKPTASWILYDVANSAFSTAVMAGFFPIFFKEHWGAGVDATVSTFRLGVTNSTASLLVAVLAPLLGAVADAGGTRRKYLLAFAGLGVARSFSTTHCWSRWRRPSIRTPYPRWGSRPATSAAGFCSRSPCG